MVHIKALTHLGWVTGEDSINRTGSRFGIHATDLGVCWENGRGEVLVAFGDSYGAGWGGAGAGPAEADWRWNTLARSTTADLDRGLLLDDVVRRPDGNAAQILLADDRVPEHTVVPTSGISVAGRDYLHYMSVRTWGPPGEWRTNHGGVAYSDDGGHSWTRPSRGRWTNREKGDHPFQFAAFAKPPEDDGRVYALGTANGRFGGAVLTTVPAQDVADAAAYSYFNGDGWSTDPFAARPVMSGPIGELSVQYNSNLGCWVALHLDEHRAAIVLRTARRLSGPWTDGEIVVSGRDYPGLYGGFLHPHGADRPAAYFLLSLWAPYNVMLMRADLAGDG